MQRVPLGKAKTIDDDEEDFGSLLDAACQSRGDLVQCGEWCGGE